MEFLKYNSIENSYQNKFIKRFINQGVYVTPMVMLEKLHGCNFSIQCENNEIRFASKNQFLNENSNFYNFQDALKNINLDGIKKFAKKYKNVVFYAELFGDGIQKGISYQKEKKLNFIEIKINGQYLSYVPFKQICMELSLEIAPVVKENIFLEKALEFDLETFKSLINKDASDDNIAEGVVIRPMFEEIYNGYDRFIIKYKSKKFAEKSERKKRIEAKDPIVEKWNNILLEYVTENRMNNLFSKEGIIENNKDIGKYIKLYIQDVMEDFLKDYPEFRELDLTKIQKKKINNIQKPIIEFLYKEL